METRTEDGREEIFLIGFPEERIEGNKLPSNRQVLQVFFHALRVESGNNTRSAASKAIKLTEEFWQKARIPIRRTQKSIEKLEGLYNDWKKLMKSQSRQTTARTEQVKLFEESLDDLFDIAHNDALKLITIEDDKQFLINQQKKGRIGYMSSVDEKLAKKESIIEVRHCQEEIREQKVAEEILASGMVQFLNKITFHSVQLDGLIMNKSDTTIKLQKKVQEMIDQGIIKPIQRTIFHADEVEPAFRYMAAGKHIGKVMIKIRDEKDLQTKPIPYSMKAKPRVLCKRDKSYLIVGGLGGFGLELADWLILRGARNIVLSSRTGVKNGYQTYRIKLWRSYGANVVIATDNVTTEEGTKKLLMKTNSMGPIAGIFNLALVLEDSPFPNQTDESFSVVAGPKAIATRNLDKLSREMCPLLEYFVVFSSVACGRGNVDQTNYGFTSSIMERICELRHADNLPALAVQWGAIGEVGIVADFAENHVDFVIGGTLQQKVRSCLDTLDSFMRQQQYPVIASMVVAEKRHGDSDIINIVANIIGIKDLKTINLTWTFPELGLDSIMGVEMKQVLESEFNTFFTPNDLQTMTFAKLHKLKEDKKKSLKLGVKPVTQYHQLSMNAKLMKCPFLKIPINDVKMKKPEDFEKTQLFIFPGMEGIASFMEPLAQNLLFQATCFQYYDEKLPVNSLPKMSEYFVKFILDSLKPDQEFFIVGYSVGGSYATEVVRNLEEKGRKGYLYLIDGSPLFMASKAAYYLNKNKSLSNDEAIQNDMCIQLLRLALPNKALDEYFPYIEKADGWEAKKKVICSITSQLKIDETLVNNVLDKTYSFIKIFFNYESTYTGLDTPCTLIRITENQYNLDESYGLKECFKNPVQIHKIEANHYTILGHPRTAEIINDCPLWKTS